MTTKSIWGAVMAVCLAMAPLGCGAADDVSAEEERGEHGTGDGADDGEELIGTAELALTTVNYSTYLGGSGEDYATGVAVDGSGNVYIVGTTASLSAGDWDADIFVRKLSPTGALVYHVTIGGSGDEGAGGIAVDSVGNVYVAGYTTYFNGTPDVLVAKINAAGTALLYYSYFGGTDIDVAGKIAIDGAGRAYVTGQTHSVDFPVTAGMPQSTLRGINDAFVTKINASGNALLYSTYLGGDNDDSGTGIAVDAYGYAYVTGVTGSANFPTTSGAFQTQNGGHSDAFVTELIPSGAGFYYSTYLGGDGLDYAGGIAIDRSFNAYVTGYSYSTDFPTTPGAFSTYNAGDIDAFVTKLNASGSAVHYSTYVGGSNPDVGFDIAVGSTGKAFVAGWSSSSNFPVTFGAFQNTKSAGSDAVVIELNATGSALSYSTYVGGSHDDVAMDIAINSGGNAYVVGDTYSTNFPTLGATQPAQGGGYSDAFVLKINGP